jgi:hypothetical protein
MLFHSLSGLREFADYFPRFLQNVSMMFLRPDSAIRKASVHAGFPARRLANSLLMTYFRKATL